MDDVRKSVELTYSELGKLPPQAVEVEESVLGAIMIEKGALQSVMDILRPESFYKDQHQLIYQAAIDIDSKGQPVDLLTVTEQLKRKGELELVGGAYYITDLTTKINSATNIETHARIILERAIKRQIITNCSESLNLAYEDTEDAFELLDKTQNDMLLITEKSVKKDVVKFSSLLTESLTILEDKPAVEGITGVQTHLSLVDKKTGGLQPGDLIIIAARPGMGKSSAITSCVLNIAKNGDPVAIFSLEMPNIQIVNRIQSAEAGINLEVIKKRQLTEDDWERLLHKVGNISDIPIFIDDTAGLSLLELRAKARRLVSKHGVKIIFIDYLQLMTDTSSSVREQQISNISRGLKQLAKDLNIPVVALSQLSRAVETRAGDKRPQLSDLRESGSIEADADMVAFLYRPEYYGITSDDKGRPTEGLGEFIIAKNRNGETGGFYLKFIGKYTKWEDYIEPPFSPPQLDETAPF